MLVARYFRQTERLCWVDEHQCMQWRFCALKHPLHVRSHRMKLIQFVNLEVESFYIIVTKYHSEINSSQHQIW